MLDQFHAELAEVLIVVPEKDEKAARYAGAMGFGGKVIPDKQKEIYRQYGLDTSLLGAMQKSEVFVIDALGEIAFAQGHGSPLRLPKVSDVFDVVKSLDVRYVEQK